MSINRDASGTPQRIGMIAVDVMTGLYAYQAISSALLRKFRFGKGAYIDCSLMQSAAAFQSAKVMEHYLEGGAPQVLYVPVGTMQTADGYINITAMRERHYVSLCKVLGREDLADDPRYNAREKRIEREAELMPVIREAFLKRTTAEWAEALTEEGVMNAPVSTYSHFLEDEHVKARKPSPGSIIPACRERCPSPTFRALRRSVPTRTSTGRRISANTRAKSCCARAGRRRRWKNSWRPERSAR